MSNLLRVTLVFVLAVCSSSVSARARLMQPATDLAPVPAAGKALVIFIRPSGPAGLIAASVYDAPDSGDTFIGILKNKDKVAYQAEPGPHRFMVIGENADFLDAVLEADKTYRVLIKPRLGWNKARFSLVPVHNLTELEHDLQAAHFKVWDLRASFVEKTPAAEAWYLDNKSSVDGKKVDYLKDWNEMDAKDRALLVLNAEDGIVEGG